MACMQIKQCLRFTLRTESTDTAEKYIQSVDNTKQITNIVHSMSHAKCAYSSYKYYDSSKFEWKFTYWQQTTTTTYRNQHDLVFSWGKIWPQLCSVKTRQNGPLSNILLQHDYDKTNMMKFEFPETGVRGRHVGAIEKVSKPFADITSWCEPSARDGWCKFWSLRLYII